jgi:hypothetical protein
LKYGRPERFVYFNFRYLVAAFYRLGHPLRDKLEVLGALNMVDLVASESFMGPELPPLLGTSLIDGHMEKELANIQGAMYSLVAPRKVLTVMSGYDASCILYTDGSLIEGCVGFAVHQMGVGGFGHKIPSPAGVFNADLSALITALRHIAEVIRPQERCLILTDSLSSFKDLLSKKIAHQTHPLMYECKQLCWSLSDFQSLARLALMHGRQAK